MVPHAWCQDVRVAFCWVTLLTYYETVFWDDVDVFVLRGSWWWRYHCIFNDVIYVISYVVSLKCLSYMLILLLWISPLLLELPPCGQVQVTKLRCADVRSLVWCRRIALIRNGMGSMLWVYSFMYHVELFYDFKFVDEFLETFMRPRAKTFLKGFWIMISAATLIYFAKDKLLSILF